MSDQNKKNPRPSRPQQDEKKRGRSDRPSHPGKPAGTGADKAERRRPGKDKTGGRGDQGNHSDKAGNDRSRGGRPAGPGKGSTPGGTGADKKRAGRPAPGGKPGDAGRDGRGRPGHKGPDDSRSGGRGADRPSGKSRQEHASGRGLRDARDTRDVREIRAPRRDGTYGTAWQGAEALFPRLTEEARHILEQLPQALSRVWPLSKAHRRTLPDDVAHLSRLLTTERAALDRPYWSSPAFVSAYLYYFLPWNLVRLTRLLSAIPLPDPHLAAPQDGKALLLDVGSGPLTLPLALWLARPQWRQAPIQVLALDNSSQPLELGRALLEELAGLTFHEPWAVQVARGQMEHAARHAAPLLAGGQTRPWLVSAANVLNELRFGKRSGRGSSLEERLGLLDDDAPDDFGSADDMEDMGDDGFSGGGHILRPGRSRGREAVDGERPEDCRQEKLVRFLDSLAPLFHSRYAAPQGPALLFVEPGTRLGGSTIMDLRQLAVEGGLTALAPCPHQAGCPLSGGQGGRTWCHFTFGSEGAPRWLEELSADSGLAKSGLSLAPLLLAPVSPAEAARMAPEGPHGPGRPPRSGVMKARVLTAPFAVPGLAGRGRYACSACGLLLLEDADGLPSGHILDVTVAPDAARDAKSGARIVRRPGTPSSVQAPRRAQGRNERGGR
ncbi:small ribosomal subunit Rsm22 family protein [Desulfovibrio sp.]|uniref:small ribosomal subunit Rsm22 family protein n=1 Tax=Desulfovibrio sp. TaxID=885 RepID=UPI0025BBA9E3|nr:small ribosomal subunit Rsm22 family protein [Desulfovibrio sp.]